VHVIGAGCDGSYGVLGNTHKGVEIAFHPCLRCSAVGDSLGWCGEGVFRIHGCIKSGMLEGIREEEVRCNGEKKRAVSIIS
jgi:hypothetical protein